MYFKERLFEGERTDSKGYTKKTYRSSESDCKNSQCCGATTKFKKIDSLSRELREQHRQALLRPHAPKAYQHNPEYSKKLSKIRSRTVEPVLGTLINFLNMRRLNSRGMASANKHVLLSAMCYNLKKQMKPKNEVHEHHEKIFYLNYFNRENVKIVAKSLQKTSLIVGEFLFFLKAHIRLKIFDFKLHKLCIYNIRFKNFNTLKRLN